MALFVKEMPFITNKEKILLPVQELSLERKMITVNINNCNNINSAKIQLLNNHLNIRFGMNGTGKSTIARAIDLKSKNESLSLLKEFGSDIEPTCLISQEIDKVLLFDEEFVNTIVFKESEVIQNAFEVFIKTPEYEEKQKSINERLKNINIDIQQNLDLQTIISVGRSVLLKFSLTKTNEFKQQGLIKSLTDSESIFKLPEKIRKFQPLMEKEYNVDWVGWKSEGAKYDDNRICPFCTSTLNDEYENEKEVFTSSYTKSNVKNIMEILGYINSVKEFMDENKSKNLYRCIKETKDKQAINLCLKRFYDELFFLVEKTTKVTEFNTFQIRSDDISNLDTQLNNLKIDISVLEIFNNQKVKDLISFINMQIDSLLIEIDLLKSDIGQLKSLLISAKTRAITDINDFLNTAGINYKFEIREESENKTKTILRYISKSKDTTEVDNIKTHLSWGERNAFALVLFMHFALSQKSEIIILDDPISSFDANKKYAIINRLFQNSPRKNSFYKKTVLMLTHDLQPIIDCVINNKPNYEFVSAYYLQNKAGIISELEITETDIKPLIMLLTDNSKNETINKIHRVASLRKLLEHIPCNSDAQGIAYNLLSCLLHGKTTPTYKNGSEIPEEDFKSGESFIRQYISDFSYNAYSLNVFTANYLLRLFTEEDNSYIRLQIFRVLLTLLNLKSKITDDPLLKYIDEQFHVENDYMYYLDFMKYDLVPDFVIPKCLEFLKQEGLIPDSKYLPQISP